MTDIFQKRIDNHEIGLVDVKQWADALEVAPKEVLDQIQDWDDKQWAVFAYCGEDPYLIDDITDLEIDTDTVHINGEDIYVLTDDEADDLASDMLDNFIDDCVLSQIPEHYRNYFDSEKFKEDALNYDGRESQLAAYDGYEHSYTVDGCDIYIYRRN